LNWYELPIPNTAWLVDGLIPADGHAAICGKPKAGKSTFIRNLIAATIKGSTFLGRRVDIPVNTGRVLYLHLDRKDQPWRVAKELRELGVTQTEASRLIFRTAADLPSNDFSERLEWFRNEIVAAKPNLVVVDLLWQFVVAKNSNDYNAVLDGINKLQDELTDVKYPGAFVAALHGRKATNINDPADDMLGSTGQRGSFSTNVFLTRHRNQHVYTVLTEQTVREECFGEIDETVIERNPDGTLCLGRPFRELEKAEKNVREESALRRVVDYIAGHQGCLTTELIQALGMSRKTVIKLLDEAHELLSTTGEGVKGNPLKYFIKENQEPKVEAMRVMSAFGGIN
jgi:hypothetical protein